MDRVKEILQQIKASPEVFDALCLADKEAKDYKVAVKSLERYCEWLKASRDSLSNELAEVKARITVLECQLTLSGVNPEGSNGKD